MSSHNSDEIDLGALIDKINAFFRGILVSIYKVINFTFRNWLILLILIVLGAALGYFSNSTIEPSKAARVVLRTNFNSAEYTYNSLALLLEKSKQNDSVFLRRNGFNGDTIEIKDLEILPRVNFSDIVEKYEPNDRNLDALLRYVEFDESEVKVNSFNPNYKYHTAIFTLSPSATDKTIDNVMKFLNNTSIIKELSRVGKQNIIDNIERNNKTFAQIDTLLDNYSKGQPLPSPSSQIFVVDKNFNISNMLELKMELQKENKKLKEELVYADNAIVKLSEESVYEDDGGISGNKIIFYPLLFILLFFFISWLLHVYRYMKRIAQDKD